MFGIVKGLRNRKLYAYYKNVGKDKTKKMITIKHMHNSILLFEFIKNQIMNIRSK
ncbi:MAG: hypothetical protein ACOC2W_03740 [bacterium]